MMRKFWGVLAAVNFVSLMINVTAGNVLMAIVSASLFAWTAAMTMRWD